MDAVVDWSLDDRHEIPTLSLHPEDNHYNRKFASYMQTDNEATHLLDITYETYMRVESFILAELPGIALHAAADAEPDEVCSVCSQVPWPFQPCCFPAFRNLKLPHYQYIW